MSTDMQSANDFLMQEGGKAFQFEPLGAVCQGEVISAEVKQQTDVDTGERLTWNDGSPRNQLVITLQTKESNSEDDDGIRVVYAKGGQFDIAEGEGMAMKPAIAKAVKEAGAKGIDPGGILGVAFTGLGVKKSRGMNAPKLYTAFYKPPTKSVSGSALFDES